VTRNVAVAIAFVLVLGIAPARAAEPPVAAPTLEQIDWGQAPEYRIVPGDELALNFGPHDVDANDLIRDVVVRSDGRITVFPIGDVVAAGRTPVELQAELVRLLSADYRQPRVTVELKKTAANRVHVLGRVRKPGSLEAPAMPTLLQVIADAGGFEDDAARNSVVVMHRVGLSAVSVARVRVDRLLKGGGDVPLSRFDIVYVPRSSIGNLNVFVDQFFTRVMPVGSFAFLGWELFHMERVFAEVRAVVR